MAEAPSMSPMETTVAKGMALGVEPRTKTDTPETRLAREVQKRIDQKDGGGALKDIAEGVDAQEKFVHDDWKDTAKAEIFTDIDPSTGDGMAKAGEQESLDKIIKAGETYEKYSKEGFDALGNETDTLSPEQEQLCQGVEGFIMSNQSLVEAIPKNDAGEPDPAVLRQIAISTLKNSGFKDQFIKHFNGLFNKSRPDKAQALGSKAKAQAAEIESGALKQGIAKLLAEKTAAEAKRKEFDETPDSTGETRTKKLENLTVVVDSKIPSGLQGADREAALDALAGDPDVQAYRDLLNERNNLDLAIKTGNVALLKAQADLAEKQKSVDEESEFSVQRQNESKAFAESVENAVIDTAREYFNARVQAKMQEYTHYKSEILGELQKEVDDLIKKHLAERWTNTGAKEKHGEVVYDKTKTQRDINAIIAASVDSKGNSVPPDRFMEQVLRNAGVSDEQLTLLMNDKTFIEAQRSDILAKTLTAHVAGGGEMKNIVGLLASTEWGQKAFCDWASKNGNARKWVEEKTGRNFSEESLKNLLVALNKKDRKTLSLILLIALGLLIPIKDIMLPGRR